MEAQGTGSGFSANPRLWLPAHLPAQCASAHLPQRLVTRWWSSCACCLSWLSPAPRRSPPHTQTHTNTHKKKEALTSTPATLPSSSATLATKAATPAAPLPLPLLAPADGAELRRGEEHRPVNLRAASMCNALKGQGVGEWRTHVAGQGGAGQREQRAKRQEAAARTCGRQRPAGRQERSQPRGPGVGRVWGPPAQSRRPVGPHPPQQRPPRPPAPTPRCAARQPAAAARPPGSGAPAWVGQ